MNAIARDPRQLGSVLRRIRKQRGWSQKVLAGKAGLRQETISLLENGNPAARMSTIFNLLAVLDLEFRVMPRNKTPLVPGGKK